MYDVIPEKNLEKYSDRLFHMVDERRIICTEIPRTEKSVVERFLALDGLTSAVSDALDELGVAAAVAGSEIKPLPGQHGNKTAGSVGTLRFVPERTTCTQGVASSAKSKPASRDLFAISQEGDVYVVDMDGAAISGCGGMAASMAKQYGLAGIVVDGGVRDVEEIRALGIPAWSRHVTPVTCKHRVEAITLNGPVIVGGVQVLPGDLCVADDTGLCFIPYELVDKVLEICEAAAEKEARLQKVMRSGGSVADMLDVMPADKW